jgi:NADPH-dependent 2,4-dienoyl-CoA reductase/sulfur reductase-like enzyme/peroxiredoxin family protein/TusA-related sulfurtransferase/rhodanese-related sulfurtransferase
MAKKLRTLVIGGVAGGATFAARARRLSETAEIIVFERGEYISFANCGLPYHIAGTIPQREQLLLQTPEKMLWRYNIEVRTSAEVTNIDRANKKISIREIKTGKQYSEPYDVLVLSPGAKPIIPAIPGINSKGIFTLRNMNDMDAINAWISTNQPRNAAIIGGGYIGLEMTEALHQRNLQVSIVELATQVMGPIDSEMASLLHQELITHGIKMYLGVSAEEFSAQQDHLSIKLSSAEVINADLVILAIGVKPEIELAKNAGLAIGILGGIVVDEYLRTNDTDIYAIGDVIEVTELVAGKPALIPLAGPANRQGRIVADNIFGRNSAYKATQGTGVCKVFNLTVGMTGINEKVLIRQNKNYEKIYLHTGDHASYYPNSTPITLKLLFNPIDGTIYGAQAIGEKGVDKKIDVIATALRAKLKVFDLQDLELSYAPPYGSAKDIVNYAGFIASNVIYGDTKICHTKDVIEQNKFLLDVRTAEEFLCGSIPGAVNIPLDELRTRLAELPRDKEIIVFCKVGLRGYLANRILMQNNYQCRNLSGGYNTYLLATNKITHPETVNNVSCAAKEDIGEKIIKTIDARGLQCPGPIQQLKSVLDTVQNGELIEILTSDHGFLKDAPAWCKATGNLLVSSQSKNGGQYTVICKGIAKPIPTTTQTKNMSIVVFSGDLDKALAAFIIANGAAAMGYSPTLFFTFWGLNILRKDSASKVKKTFIEKMFGKMMPRGAKKLALSKMNFCGIGSAMIKNIMRKKNVSSLPELIATAQQNNNIHLVACTMTMDLMGIKQEELLDNVTYGGVASYLQNAGESGINLFI